MPKGECWRRQLSLDTGETWVLLPGGISRREVLKYDDYLREITHTHTHTQRCKWHWREMEGIGREWKILEREGI